MNRDDILGRWWVKSWRQVYDDGRVKYPMGQNLTGFITYDATRMTCMIMRSDRPGFLTGGQWDAADADKAAAYDSILSYSGTWDLAGDTISHNVDICLFPGWVGGTQKRQAELKDGLLSLTARMEDGTPEARTAYLEWVRE